MIQTDKIARLQSNLASTLATLNPEQRCYLRLPENQLPDIIFQTPTSEPTISFLRLKNGNICIRNGVESKLGTQVLVPGPGGGCYQKIIDGAILTKSDKFENNGNYFTIADNDGLQDDTRTFFYVVCETLDNGESITFGESANPSFPIKIEKLKANSNLPALFTITKAQDNAFHIFDGRKCSCSVSVYKDSAWELITDGEELGAGRMIRIFIYNSGRTRSIDFRAPDLTVEPSPLNIQQINHEKILLANIESAIDSFNRTDSDHQAFLKAESKIQEFQHVKKGFISNRILLALALVKHARYDEDTLLSIDRMLFMEEHGEGKIRNCPLLVDPNLLQDRKRTRMNVLNGLDNYTAYENLVEIYQAFLDLPSGQSFSIGYGSVGHRRTVETRVELRPFSNPDSIYSTIKDVEEKMKEQVRAEHIIIKSIYPGMYEISYPNQQISENFPIFYRNSYWQWQKLERSEALPVGTAIRLGPSFEFKLGVRPQL